MRGKASALRRGDQTETRKLGKSLRRIIRRDRRKRIYNISVELEHKLDGGDVRGFRYSERMVYNLVKLKDLQWLKQGDTLTRIVNSSRLTLS